MCGGYYVFIVSIFPKRYCFPRAILDFAYPQLEKAAKEDGAHYFTSRFGRWVAKPEVMVEP